mgnify:CR=1 FL=1
MSNRLPVNKDRKYCYEIVLEQDFSKLTEELERLEWNLSYKKIVGICIKSIPLKKVAAQNPVKSPTTPPPNAKSTSFLVKCF